MAKQWTAHALPGLKKVICIKKGQKDSAALPIKVVGKDLLCPICLKIVGREL